MEMLGHYEKGGGHLAKIRTRRSYRGWKKIRYRYTVLDNHDGELFSNIEVKAIKL